MLLGVKGFDGFAQHVIRGFGDDLFGCISVLCDGLGACVSVLSGSDLESGSHIAIVVEEALPHVGGELVNASLFDVPEPVFNFLRDALTFFLKQVSRSLVKDAPRSDQSCAPATIPSRFLSRFGGSAVSMLAV